MEIHDRIKGLRLQRSMTQKEFAEVLGVSIVSIRCWETGSKNPSMSAIIAIATTFEVTTDYLLGIAKKPDYDSSLLSSSEQKLLSNYRSLDHFGKKAVETICSLEKSRILSELNPDKIVDFQKSSPSPSRYIPRYTTPSAAGSSVPLDGDDFEMILVDDSVPYDADFAVGIQGNSMLPYIHDGDTVYVKRDCDLRIGDVGIFCVDGAMFCKQYYIDEGRNLTLVSANPRLRHTNVHISADSGSSVQCYGKVLLDQRITLPDYFEG